MGVVLEYNYKPELMLTYGQEGMPLTDMIRSIILNYDFDKMNMPAIYIQLSLSNVQYNNVISHKEDGVMIFTLYKFDASSNSPLQKKYISDSFTYMMTSNPDYNESLNSGSNQRFTKNNSDNELESDSYLNGYIALIKEDSINTNKRITNSIIKNSNLISIIHKYTSNMQMVIEPIDSSHNVVVDQLIVKPTETITNLLKYLNSVHSFYDSGYRYFRDFDKTYLLSNKGSAVNIHDGSYSKVLITICDPLEVLDSGVAMEIDSANKAYLIKVNANDTSMNVAQNIDKNYNSIISVDSSGNTSKTNLNVSAHSSSTEKVQIQKAENSNLNNITQNKSYVESSGIVLTITKANLDSSILTPNKEYIVKNYQNNRQYDGSYILSYKKEVLVKDGDYIISTMFGLRKVSN